MQCEATKCRAQARCRLCKIFLWYLDNTVWVVWFNFVLAFLLLWVGARFLFVHGVFSFQTTHVFCLGMMNYSLCENLSNHTTTSGCIWKTQCGCCGLTSSWRFRVCEFKLVFLFVHGVFSFQIAYLFLFMHEESGLWENLFNHWEPMRMRVEAYSCHTTARFSTAVNARRFMWWTWDKYVRKNDVLFRWHRGRWLLRANFFNLLSVRETISLVVPKAVYMGLV